MYSEGKLKEKSIMTNITSSFRRYRIVSANDASRFRYAVSTVTNLRFPENCKFPCLFLDAFSRFMVSMEQGDFVVNSQQDVREVLS